MSQIQYLALPLHHATVSDTPGKRTLPDQSPQKPSWSDRKSEKIVNYFYIFD
jgi:hypothetical protein